jgi:hypothetical protein
MRKDKQKPHAISGAGPRWSVQTTSAEEKSSVPELTRFAASGHCNDFAQAIMLQ